MMQGPPEPRSATVTPQPPPRRRPPRSRSERRRRAHRRRVAATTAVLLALTVVALVIVVPRLTGREADATRAAPTPTAAASVQDGPVLFTLLAADGRASAAALVQDDATKTRSSILLVPTGLIVDVPGVGPQPLATATQLPMSDAAAKAVADMLGLSVPGSWQLTEEGLARLVDALGGVEVTVDAEVLDTRPDGSRVVAVPPGRRTLDGAAATAYATWLAPGEPEQSRLARFTAVLEATLARLPDRPDQVRSILDALASTSSTTVSDLADTVAGLAAHARDDTVDYDVLPTRVLETGGPEDALTLDRDAATATVTRLFPAALRASPGTTLPRVLVQNGVGTPGLGTAARDRLVAAGFAYVGGGNAAELGQRRTLVVVPDSSRANRALGARVAAVLGVPADAVRVASQQQSVADVMVVLGADFTPHTAGTS